jgi:hypothetical protein
MKKITPAELLTRAKALAARAYAAWRELVKRAKALAARAYAAWKEHHEDWIILLLLAGAATVVVVIVLLFLAYQLGDTDESRDRLQAIAQLSIQGPSR